MSHVQLGKCSNGHYVSITDNPPVDPQNISQRKSVAAERSVQNGVVLCPKLGEEIACPECLRIVDNHLRKSC